MIDWEKQFPVACINRADLTEFGLTDQQITEVFTDDVMKAIAANMQESYFTSPAFWLDFKRAISSFIELPDGQTTGGEDG